MKEIFDTASSFGIALTLLVYLLACRLSRRFNTALLSPVLLAGGIIIILLLLSGIEYETYAAGADWINRLMAPAAVCYAVPLYKQIATLKEHFKAIIISVSIGCLVSLGSVYACSRLFQFEDVLLNSLLPKSVTTAIGISVSEKIGGITSITIAAILFTGILGGAMAVTVCRLFRVRHPVAKGLAIGASSHVIGTSKAIEMGETEGAMSSLALVLTGVITVLAVSLTAKGF